MGVLRRLLNRQLPPRVAVVQAELHRFPRARYLEIGVNVGVLFLHVRAHRKVAVDPVQRIARWKRLAHPNTAIHGEFVELTSDEYFASIEPAETFDVVFVDGLHTYDQSLRDVENALAHLSEDGVVLVHDCNPTSATAAGPQPEKTGGAGWCGDVWKTIAHLRANRGELDVETLDTDYGIGVIRRRSVRVPTAPLEVGELTYSDLAANRRELLGLRAL
jgi:SAM-dependent methyltransferase